MLPAQISKSIQTKASTLTEVFEVSHLLTFAAFQNVTISVWRDTPTAAALTKVEPYVRKVTNKYPRVASVIVMESLDFRAPAQDARAEHGRLTKEFEQVTFGVAMIVDGSSARHSVYRFVLSTMTLLSAPTVTHRIFQTVGVACSWLVGLEPSLNKLALVAAINEARSLPW